MNLILLFQEDFIDGANHVRLQGRRLTHVREVHRAQLGDEFCVGILSGRIGAGRVTKLDSSVLEMEVWFEQAPPPKLPLTLILALPRPKVLKRVLRSASSLGVQRIILINSFRVEKSFWQSPVLSSEGLREQLIIGLEQARDTVLPEVLLRPLFKLFVEDELPGLIKGALSLVAHPLASDPCPRDIKQPAALAIGPEGGFITYEIDYLLSRGFIPVQIGKRILSVETAVPALVSKLF
ncbi:MAG TPA: 16S rRNA (uracil(1498)-N(3))-methyltransferase [Nitrospirota bacterium]|nr:16S rRNA (uracil(1498)-N(3))-methyltransferase [Nitrospirota bacterium]